MKKVFENLMQLDTTTRYEIDGTIIVTPEEWHENEQVCKYPKSYNARVKVAKNGKTVIRRNDSKSGGALRYEELFCNEVNGVGCRVRRTRDHLIVRITVNRDQTPAQLRRDTHSKYLDGAGWMKGADKVLSE